MFISLPYHVVNCACILRHLSKKFTQLEDLARVSIIQTNLPNTKGLAGNSEYATQADWVINSHLALAILAYSTLYGRCHLVCVVPVQCCPGAWNFRLNTDANMLCRLFNDHKQMDIYLHIHQEYSILENKKSVCIFQHQRVNTCDLHTL